MNMPFGLDELDDLISASKWHYARNAEIQKRPKVLDLPESTEPLREGNFSHMDTLNIFKWSKLAILHPFLATYFHRLIMHVDFREKQRYDLYIGGKLEYLLTFMKDNALPEQELERLLQLANDDVHIPWRLCHFDQVNGARRNEVTQPGVQARECLSNGCPYFHTKSLKLIMEEADIRMDDDLTGDRKEESDSSSEEEKDVAAKLKPRADTGNTQAGGVTGMMDTEEPETEEHEGRVGMAVEEPVGSSAAAAVPAPGTIIATQSGE